MPSCAGCPKAVENPVLQVIYFQFLELQSANLLIAVSYLLVCQKAHPALLSIMIGLQMLGVGMVLS